jgi:hypothetical protein
MNKELEDKLYEDFPELFQEHTLDMTQTCMCWGIECGDGWEQIIRQMCELLSRKICTTAEKKQKFPYQYNLEVWLYNKCRKIEKWLKLPYNSLYKAKFDRYDRFPGFGVKFTQIKEKFGTLRIYYEIYPKFSDEQIKEFSKKDIARQEQRFAGYVDGITAYAEHLSAHTCYTDGKPGKLYTKGWWHVACDECENKKQKNANTSNS